MSVRREVAFAGGAALAAGLLLGFMVDRLRRFASPEAIGPVPAARARRVEPASTPPGEVSTRDVLERYRLAAAV
jgi:riboflavin biosynthesis pyrimidine reductase